MEIEMLEMREERIIAEKISAQFELIDCSFRPAWNYVNLIQSIENWKYKKEQLRKSFYIVIDKIDNDMKKQKGK